MSRLGIFGTRTSRRGTAGSITCSFGGFGAAAGGVLWANDGVAAIARPAVRGIARRSFRMGGCGDQKKNAMPSVTALYSALSASDTYAV